MPASTTAPVTQRERELGAIINAYNEVTDRLKHAHEQLTVEVQRLQGQLDEKNRELARRERLAALGEMAAGVAHEIRNPLAGIQLYASLLERDLSDDPTLLGLAKRISVGVQTLDGIVTDVLAFAGDAEPQTSCVILKTVVADCLAYAEPALAKSDTRIHVASSVESAKVLADGGQLQRALLNLIGNAIDGAGVSGNVWISATHEVETGQVAIMVADDGEGIPDDLRQRIFNPFFTTKDSGTGLGLAIVHRIAEAHGGGISAGSRADGGALMTLRIPVWTDSMCSNDDNAKF